MSCSKLETPSLIKVGCWEDFQANHRTIFGHGAFLIRQDVLLDRDEVRRLVCKLFHPDSPLRKKGFNEKTFTGYRVWQDYQPEGKFSQVESYITSGRKWKGSILPQDSKILEYGKMMCELDRKVLGWVWRILGHTCPYTAKTTNPLYSVHWYNPARKGDAFPTHKDWGLLSIVLPGLGALVGLLDGVWVDVNVPDGYFLVNFSKTLELITEGRVSALVHRVTPVSTERVTLGLFMDPKDVVYMPDGSPMVKDGKEVQYSDLFEEFKAEAFDR